MILVGPNYLNSKILPFASDIFYHKKIGYLLPTGFHPTEINSVLEFPNYCKLNSIALPSLVWKMCDLYFENTRQALEASDILKPLHNDFITLIQTSYPRNRAIIDETKKFIKDNPKLLECFERTSIDLCFISREVLSHILFEIFIEEGYRGVVQYIRENFRTEDDFILLIAATIINRLKLFEGDSIDLLLYDHSWIPLIDTYMEIRESCMEVCKNRNDDSDSFMIDNMCYKLFEGILMPIFGRCDTQDKASLIKKIVIKKQDEIERLKQQCRVIAMEILLTNTSNTYLKQEKLRSMLKKSILQPLKDIKELLVSFLLDSTVIGGFLSIVQQPDINALSLSVAAGAVSAGARYIFNEESKRICNPSDLLLTGLKKMRIEYEDYAKQIEEISLKQVFYSKK